MKREVNETFLHFFCKNESNCYQIYLNNIYSAFKGVIEVYSDVIVPRPASGSSPRVNHLLQPLIIETT